MKTQILIEDGVTQIVLTPETDFETTALAAIKDGETVVAAHRGEFAMCQGGYLREFDRRPNTRSLVLVVKPPVPAPASCSEAL